MIFYTGTTAIGAGTPGGRGFLLELCRPIPYINEIAARYPELRIIMAHPAWPWHDDQLAVVRNKGNVYLHGSFRLGAQIFLPVGGPECQYADSRQGFFGSDFPVISPERWLSEFAALPIKDAVHPKILLHNATKFLGIELPSGATA